MIKDLNIKNTMVPILNKIKKESFVDGYEASDEEAFGLLLSKYFKWDGYKIFSAAHDALEDANFHSLNTKLRRAFQDWECESEPSDFDFNSKASPLHY
jgi:hypothetical protein